MQFRVLRFCRSWRAGADWTSGYRSERAVSTGRVGRRVSAIIAYILLMSACSAPTATQIWTAPATVEPVVVDEVVIVYSFYDSSVPPPSHRSLELTVSQPHARLVIDSYGEVLADESRPTPPEVWSALIDGLASLVALRVDGAQEGCVGGTGEAVRVSLGKQVIVDLAVDECAGSNERVSEAIGRWIKPVRDVFPPIHELAPTG